MELNSTSQINDAYGDDEGHFSQPADDNAPLSFNHQEEDRVQSSSVSDRVSPFNSGSYTASAVSEQAIGPGSTSSNKDVLVRGSPYDPATARPRPRRDISTEDRDTITDEDNTPYPTELTFLDRKTGIEYAPDGEIISLPPPPERPRRPNQPLQTGLMEFDEIHPEHADQPGQARKPASTDHPFPIDQGYRTPLPYSAGQPHSSGYPYRGDQSYRISQPYGSGHPFPSNQSYGGDAPYISGSGQSYIADQAYPGGQPYRADQTYGWGQPYGVNAGTVSSNTVILTQPETNTATVTADFSDRMVESCLVTWFCCCILGLVALHYANEARQLKERRRYAEAKLQAMRACNWNVTGVVLGIVWITVSTILALKSQGYI